MMAVEEAPRTCSICAGEMRGRKVDAVLPLLPVVYTCPVCDTAPAKRATR